MEEWIAPVSYGRRIKYYNGSMHLTSWIRTSAPLEIFPVHGDWKGEGVKAHCGTGIENGDNKMKK